MKVGNIVSYNNINVPKEFNVVQTIDEIDNSLPTLIIGWDYIDKTYPNYDITDRKIDKNISWTFKKSERRDQYEEDLQVFIIKCYKRLIEELHYVFIDPIQYDYRKLMKIIRKLKNYTENVSFFYENMVYILCDKVIFGVDLKLLTYIGYKIDKIKNKIKSISKVLLIDNTILIEYKKYIDALDNQVKYVPFLYSINHE